MSETEIEGGKFEIKFFLKQGTCCKLQFVITCLNVFSWYSASDVMGSQF